MITPQPLRAVGHAEAPVPDMRTWWQRNDRAIGVIVGTAIATILAGTGGLTGLAHVVGIATTKELSTLDERITGAMGMQKAAATAEETRFGEVNARLDAMAAEARAARADILKRLKKPRTTGGASE